MEEQLRHILKKGHDVTPSDEFIERSHRLIIATPQISRSFSGIIKRGIVENLKFSFAMALGAAMLLVVFSGVSYWENLYPGSQALNEERLLKETKDVDFQIQLAEAIYYTESAKEIAVFLEEIDETTTSKTIDNALDELIF